MIVSSSVGRRLFLTRASNSIIQQQRCCTAIKYTQQFRLQLNNNNPRPISVTLKLTNNFNSTRSFTTTTTTSSSKMSTNAKVGPRRLVLLAAFIAAIAMLVRVVLVRKDLSEDSKITNWAASDGEFRRKPTTFRNHISTDKDAKYQPEKGRYHLYVSYACPWAHRTLITRKLKGLQDIIGVSVVHWHMQERGWRFAKADEGVPDAGPDEINGANYLSDIYFKTEPGYTGRYTVPVLWDKKTNTIVNNESAEIIRMFYTEFDSILDDKYKGVTYYPEHHAKAIDEMNDWIYDNINNGVYKCGFATTQEAYERNVKNLFEHLDRVESILSSSEGDYLLGKEFTEADLRLYPTIARFDPVYVQHFKCNVKMIRHDYPAIHKWLRHLYWDIPAFKETTQFEHIKKHYTKSHTQINPFSITPVGPLPDMVEKDA